MTKEEANKILSGYVKACNEDDFLALELFEYDEVIEAMTMGARALSKPSLPSNLDEAAENIISGICPISINGEYSIRKQLFDVCIAVAEWMAGQGATMEITDDTEWADLDSFVHKNVTGGSIIQIRKK